LGPWPQGVRLFTGGRGPAPLKTAPGLKTGVTQQNVRALAAARQVSSVHVGVEGDLLENWIDCSKVSYSSQVWSQRW